MNIRNESAGYIKEQDILNEGFECYETIEVSDIDSSCSLPQYRRGDLYLNGGYWNYTLKRNGKILFDGWWNTVEEFKQTLRNI